MHVRMFVFACSFMFVYVCAPQLQHCNVIDCLKTFTEDEILDDPLVPFHFEFSKLRTRLLHVNNMLSHTRLLHLSVLHIMHRPRYMVSESLHTHISF